MFGSGRTARHLRRPRSMMVMVLVAAAAGLVIPATVATAGGAVSAQDYAQCANGAPGTSAPCSWINGILNGSNSQFHENEVTPQRLMVQFKAIGTHSVTLRYLTRKAGVHAYDSLATVETTVAEALSRRCIGLPSYCAGLTAGTPTPITPDPTVVLPVTIGTGVTSTHSLSGQVLRIFGAEFATGSSPPAMTEPVHDNAANVGSDDYATTTISFVTTTANAYVQLLFGGHLSAPTGGTGWGSGLGAGSISGGPYHIKWDGADGASVGSRDNQIMSSGILPILNTTLTTVASTTATGDAAVNATTTTGAPATVGTPLTVGDTATLTGFANAPTTNVTFTLWGPYTGTATCGLDLNVTETPALAAITGTSWTGPTNSAYTQSVSHSWTPLSVGTYYWHATYPGDGRNSASGDTCGAATEKVVVGQATPTGSSTISVKDTVVVSGAGTVAGRVKFELYGPYASGDTIDCASGKLVAGTPADWASVTLASGSATTPTAYAVPKNVGLTVTEGTYSFKVTYYSLDTDGTVLDANNANSTVVKSCNTENVTVNYP